MHLRILCILRLREYHTDEGEGIMKQYEAVLHIITPVIIHTGELYDSLELIILGNQTDTINIIDLQSAFALMSDEDKENFYKYVKSLSGDEARDKNTLSALRGVVQSTALKNPDVIHTKAKASQQCVSDIANNFHAMVNKIFKDAVTGKPYIPGSSIKGALRTAILDAERARQGIDKLNTERVDTKSKKHTFDTKDFEMQIIKKSKEAIFSVPDDPFRFLKVSDFACEQKNVCFDTVRVIGNKKTQKGIPVYTEMTSAKIMSNTEYIARGTITIDESKLKFFNEKEGNRFNNMFSKENIIKSLRHFSRYLLENQKHVINMKVKQEIEKCCPSGSTNRAPLRLGRFAQIESKTFKIKREEKGKENINIEGGVSRSLIGGNIPAGWCVIEIL